MRRLALAVVVFVTLSAFSQSWYSTAWHYRYPVTIANSSGSTLANFQTKVSLTTSNFGFANCSSGGTDLRVTSNNGTTLIPFWIYNWSSGAATVWVNVPSIPTTGTTIYFYCGNPSVTSAASGDSTFDFFDDFSWKDYYQFSAPTTIMTATQSWETTPPHTISIVPMNQGGYAYWGYYGLQNETSCGGVGLAYSNDLSTWVKDPANPLWINGRWPTVIPVGSYLYMVYTKDYCSADSTPGTTHSYLMKSPITDGKNWTFVNEIIPVQSGIASGNAQIFQNPTDSLFYLYYFESDGTTSYIKGRFATTPEGLASASTYILQTSTGTLAAPSLVYLNGTYFLGTEIIDSTVSGVSSNKNLGWAVSMYGSTTSPVSGMVRLGVSPELTNGEACLMHFVAGNTLHEYTCKYSGNSWLGIYHRTIDLTQPRLGALNPAKWNVPYQANATFPTTTLPNGSTGQVLNLAPTKTTQWSPALVYSVPTFNPSGIIDAYGEQVTGRVWSVLGRVYGEANSYDTTNLYQDLGAIYTYDVLGNEEGTASVGTVNMNQWYKTTMRYSSSGGTVSLNDSQKYTFSSYSSSLTGGVGLHTEYGSSSASTANFSFLTVRKYASSEPTATVGSAQTGGAIHGKVGAIFMQ